jgi:endoglucanase
MTPSSVCSATIAALTLSLACAAPPTISPDAAASTAASRTAAHSASAQSAPCCSLLHVAGTTIVNAAGQEVRLKGLFLSNNTWGNWVWPISDELQKDERYPLIPPTEQDAWVLADADFEIFSKLALNHVVYAINYELFAPENAGRAANLAKLVAHVDRFNGLGIYVTILFADGPGLNVANGGFYAEVPGPQRLKTVFEDRTFQDEHVAFIEYVVTGVKDRPGIAGYDLIDEPLCPSNADGGIEAFRAGYNRFARAIRAIDPAHIIFAQAYNGREANPGEQYWDNKTQSFKIDRGEQAFTGPPDLVALDASIANVAYDAHTFVPYEFTSTGAPDFDVAAMDTSVRQWVAKARALGAPLIVSSYGVDTLQPASSRVRWLNAIHGAFERYGLSVAYFHYKDNVDCTAPGTGFGVYRQCDGREIKPWDTSVIDAFQGYWKP